MTLVENGAQPTLFEGIVFHGSPHSPHRIRRFRVHPERGVYFTSNAKYAEDYGAYVYRCRVKIDHPRIYSEAEANSDMEIDRTKLIDAGFDGRIIEYDDGYLDVIAFFEQQITILDVSLNS